MRVSNFEVIFAADRVVAFRSSPVSKTGANKNKRMCIDRGALMMQKRQPTAGADFYRLVLYPKCQDDWNNMETAIVIPFDCIGDGSRRIVEGKSGMTKGEVVFDLKSYIDCRIDGLERFTVWMDESDWTDFTQVMITAMNCQFPTWFPCVEAAADHP
jgi:hypothetical protein